MAWFFWTEPQRLEADFAEQVGFGQRGALVRHARFVTDERDLPIKPVLTERSRRLKTGLACPDDPDAPNRHQTWRSGRLTTKPSKSGVTTS